MENAVCGFCREGQEAREHCGKLHVEKIEGGSKQIAAHHKCMQYSAQLIQYKFSHFGGFKIDKVLEEMRRGRMMKCALCKNNKNRKGKWTGATSGCAIRKCNKSFHYYCAKIDKKTITKRMVIHYKSQNKEVVMYRVFCCLAHEKEFKSNKGDLALPANKKNEDPQDSDLSEDEDSEENDAQELSNSENGDQEKLSVYNSQDCVADSNDVDSDKTIDMYDNKDGSANTDQNHCQGDGVSNGWEMDDPDDLKPDIDASVLSADSVGDDSFEFHGSSSFEFRGSPRVTNGSPTRRKNSRLSLPSKADMCNLSTSKKRDAAVLGEINHDDKNEGKNKGTEECSPLLQTSSSKPKSPKKLETESPKNKNKQYSAAVLVITSEKHSRTLDRETIEKITPHPNVVFWLERGNIFTEEHLPFLMNDITQLISDKKYDRVVKLLTDVDELNSHLTIHDYALRLHRSLDSDVVSLMKESLYKTIGSSLLEMKKKKKRPLCSLVDVKNVKALIITLDKTIDPDEILRKALGVDLNSEMLYQWNQETFKQGIQNGSGVDRSIPEEEANTIVNWISKKCETRSHLVLRPEDDILLVADRPLTATDMVGSALAKDNLDSERPTKPSAMTVCFRCVDTEVVNYQEYVRKSLSVLTRERYDTVKQIFCVLHLDLLKKIHSIEDIIPNDVREVCKNILVFSANDPKYKPVTCLVVEVTLKDSPKQHKPRSNSEGASRIQKDNGAIESPQRKSNRLQTPVLTPSKNRKRLNLDESPKSNKRQRRSDD